jgi:F420-non-reducing hydrogenase iron-sulfur subunit
MVVNGEWEPKILGFLCICCAYAGADLAGVSRFQYPPNHRTVMVRCSGRVDPLHVLRGFRGAVDGVMVLGCHPGDCHYISGNYYARTRIGALKYLLGLTGMNPDRLLLDWVSAAEGKRFAELVTAFTGHIRALGPLGRSERLSWEVLKERLAAASDVMGNERVRWLIGRKQELMAKGDVYHQQVSEQAYDALVQSTIATEYQKSQLLIVATDRPQSVKEMAEAVGLPPRQVLPQVMALEQAGLMTMVGIEERSPKYLRAQRF